MQPILPSSKPYISYEDGHFTLHEGFSVIHDLLNLYSKLACIVWFKVGYKIDGGIWRAEIIYSSSFMFIKKNIWEWYTRKLWTMVPYVLDHFAMHDQCLLLLKRIILWLQTLLLHFNFLTGYLCGWWSNAIRRDFIFLFEFYIGRSTWPIALREQ